MFLSSLCWIKIDLARLDNLEAVKKEKKHTAICSNIFHFQCLCVSGVQDDFYNLFGMHNSSAIRSLRVYFKMSDLNSTSNRLHSFSIESQSVFNSHCRWSCSNSNGRWTRSNGRATAWSRRRPRPSQGWSPENCLWIDLFFLKWTHAIITNSNYRQLLQNKEHWTFLITSSYEQHHCCKDVTYI